MAGAGLVDDGQAHGLGGGGTLDVPGPDGKSVHGGVVEAGHLLCALDVSGEGAAKCVAEWHELRHRGTDALEHEAPCIVDLDRSVRGRRRQRSVTPLRA